MPEIKLKHVVSFSSEDKVHKAENLIKPETYRKWKCSTAGEKNATIVLQFEKASQIHSIDIGNESSAFVEVLVGRSSDNVNDFQVILVASSFMSPIESRNQTHTNRVRMFGPEKLSQNVKDEKWDCVQIVCTQPFNKSISYGLSFVKFHSPPEKVIETPKSSEAQSTTAKIGAFKLKPDDDEEDSPPVGFLFGMQKTRSLDDKQSSIPSKQAPSYAAVVLSSASMTKDSNKNNIQKRKIDDESSGSSEPPSKKSPGSDLNKDHIVYKNLDFDTDNKKASGMSDHSNKNVESNKNSRVNKKSDRTAIPSTSRKPAEKVKKKVPFGKIMQGVVIVISGFVNPLRSELRDKALEMGAKYRGDWDKTSTHLICAFLNTPKYIQVQGKNGKIVTKDWILDCYKKKTLLPWRDYMLGAYARNSSSGDESETPDEDEIEMNMKEAKTNGAKTPNKTSPGKQKISSPAMKQLPPTVLPKDESNSRDESETEDEDAIKDYIADTDVEPDSGGDTEDEIRKIENKAKKKTSESPTKRNKTIKEDSPLVEKPNIDDLPLPELPNLFKRKHFFLFGDFSSSKHHDLLRYITAYNGVIEDYMSDTVKYVITEAKWSKDFEDAVSENEDLIFIKPLWIYKCHESGKLVPYQPHIIIPDS